MGKIDEAILKIENTGLGTESAMQLAGLVSTLFKIKGIALVVTGHLAYDGYANVGSDYCSVELGAFAGKLAPRTVLEIMRGQLHGQCTLDGWTIAGIPVRFEENPPIVHRDLCRDFTSDLGVVKLMPVEEIVADCILAAVYPEPDEAAHARAHRLLVNGLTEAFQMNWSVLHALCHRPDYRVGEELAQMRLAAKKDVDASGLARDHIGETAALPSVDLTPEAIPQPEEAAPAAPDPVAAEAAILPVPEEPEDLLLEAPPGTHLRGQTINMSQIDLSKFVKKPPLPGPEV